MRTACEKPIILNSEMVRAVLDGRKSQTRRVYKPRAPYPYEDIDSLDGPPWWPHAMDEHGDYHDVPCPFGVPGMRLWVRETFRACRHSDKHPACVEYRADGETGDEKWRSPIFMPRALSRITLEVTDVRVQRVRDITEDDARAEGVTPLRCIADDQHIISGDGRTHGTHPYTLAFAVAWDTIYDYRGFAWVANPWVWAITFRRVQPW